MTKPASDSIREELTLSVRCYSRPEQNLRAPTGHTAQRLLIRHPMRTNEELAALKHMDPRDWKAKTIDITFDRAQGRPGVLEAIDRICGEVEEAISEGYSLVVLSDRAIGPDRVAVSTLLAAASVHHHLLRHAKRPRIGIVLETGEAREGFVGKPGRARPSRHAWRWESA